MKGEHNPQSKTFIQMMDRHEKTLKEAMTSEEFKNFLIWQMCHDRKWKYNHQRVQIYLAPRRQWKMLIPCNIDTQPGEIRMVVCQISEHWRSMEEIGEKRDFDDILAISYEEAWKIGELAYENQKERIVERTRSTFQYIRENGWVH